MRLNFSISNSCELLRRCANLNPHINRFNARHKSQSATDEQPIYKELGEIIEFKATNNSNWIAEV